MTRRSVAFDDLFAGDWITVHYRNRLGRVRRSSGAFRELFFDSKVWHLLKTGRIWAIPTSSVVAIDLVRESTEARR